MTEFEKDFIENKAKYVYELVKSMNVSGEEYHANVVGYAISQYDKIKQIFANKMEF